MWTYNYTNELYHHGVKGMKWGVRKASKYATRYVRGHGGPGHYLTRKSQLKGDKRDLEKLNRGEHLSVGLTKKRQAMYDARDKRKLEKRIAKNEAHYKAKAEKKAAKEAYKQTDEYKAKVEKTKKALKVGAAVAGTALAAYGAYKIAGVIKNKNNEIAIKKGREAYHEIMNNKYANTILSKNSDGTATVKQYWGNGNKAETVFRSHDAAERYHIDSEVYNNKVIEEANRVMKKVSGESYGANLVDSTKNVYKYYKKRKRR